MERRRLNGTEREAFKRLHVASDILDQVREDLWPRARDVEYARRDLAMVAGATNRVFASLLGTVPTEQLESMQRNLRGTGYTIGAKRPGQRERNTEYGIYLSWDELMTLIRYAQETCIMCAKDTQGQRSCELAKLFDVLGAEKDITATGCGYYGRV